jgi:fructosamine-3-kinase
MRIAGIALVDPRPVGGGDICRAVMARTTSGEPVFAKSLADPPSGFFEAEARGLDRLRIAGGPPVPQVRAVGPDGLVLEWVESRAPGESAADSFGRALAVLHRTGGSEFGAPTGGFVATVPLDNSAAPDWPTFAAERRLGPALRAATDRAAIDAADRKAVEAVIRTIAELAGTSEPPARLHGDLWAGNLLWGADRRVWLVDAAGAYDGHRESDLAMLALFGAPLLADVLAAYDEVFPRVVGWECRVALHQIHPLLVHAVLFGGGYGRRAGERARDALHGRVS